MHETAITGADHQGSARPEQERSLLRVMSLTDAVLLIVGGVIGGGIFLTSQDVASQLPSPILFLLVWMAGAGVSLLACFAFAELGAMFPEAGGQYVYLREAYGEFIAFLYGWIMFVAGSSGGIAANSVGFAQFFGVAVPALAGDHVLGHVAGLGFRAGHWVRSDWLFTRGDVVALLAIAALTVLNVVGLRRATVLQNIATWMKFAALAAFIGLGFLFGHGDWSHFSGAGFKDSFAHGFYPFMSVMGVAFIGVFWSYDGWIYASWLGGEIRDPQRNLPRSLMIGMALIAALYITINAVYLYALPVTGIAKSDVVAQSAASVLFSPRVAFWLSAVIALSCFGALSSNIMAGARVSYAMGRDGLFFKKMAGVHPKWRTPAFALIAQGVLSAAIAISGTYVQLFTYTMFGLMISYVVTVAAVFVLRRKQPNRPRPYLCTGYPWLPLIYIVLIGGWAINALVERPRESLAGSVLMLIGVPGYLYWKRTNRKRALS